MPCPDANALGRYVDGSAHPAECAPIDAHLDRCEECRVLVSELVRGRARAGAPAWVGDEADTLLATGLGAPPSQPELADTLVGSELGEYRIRRRLGTGGMGSVYEAEHTLIGKRVAVKVFRSLPSEQASQWFLHEAQSASSVHHRGIVQVFGLGKLDDGRPYMIMELLQGETLETLLRRTGPLGVDQALQWTDEVLAALGAAHACQVVHRDLKPANIFVVREADGARYLKLLDFGIAKRLQQASGQSQTEGRGLVGTPGFMAPEQVRGEAVGPASDLYALGGVLFQMLTGRRVFDGTSIPEVLRQHLEEAPAAPSRFVPRLPADLDGVVLALLAKEPSQRPTDIPALRDRIARLRHAAQRRPARARSALALAGLVAAALLAFLGLGPQLGSGTPPAAEERAPLSSSERSAESPTRLEAQAVQPPSVVPGDSPASRPEAGTQVTPAVPRDERTAAAKVAAHGGSREKPRRPAASGPAAKSESSGLAQERARLEARLQGLEARLAAQAGSGRPAGFQRNTLEVVRRKLNDASSKDELAALEQLVGNLEAEAR